MTELKLTPDYIEQMKDIFVPYKDLARIIDKQSERTVQLLRPELNMINVKIEHGNKRFDIIDERCRKQMKSCPVVSIDARVALANKRAALQEREEQAAIRLARIRREAKQENELDSIKHWSTKWKAWVVAAGLVAMAAISVIVWIVAEVTGIL